MFDTGEHFCVKKLQQKKDRVARSVFGRRINTKTDSKSGRYVRSRIPKGKTDDIAFDATLRAAILSKRVMADDCSRERMIDILEGDIRQKVREKKAGNAIVFVVDCSGSMGARQRMVETKGAILSLLIDSYQKRDKVGMIVFKGDKAEVLLSLTSSVELAKKQLEELPVGGKTPLAKGLLVCYKLFQNEFKKNAQIKPLMVLLSDGKANAGINTDDIFNEVKEISEEIKNIGINSIVIDTEAGMIQFNKAREIAEVLGGTYYKLEELMANNIVNAIEKNIYN